MIRSDSVLSAGMATMTPSDAPAMLDHVGVRFVTITDDRVPEYLLVEVLPEGQRAERGVIQMDPPAPGEEFSGVGAWHINNAPETHLLREGRGQVQFVTDGGIVTVLVEAGDVMIIDGAEHRFRPLTAVTWVLHYGAPDLIPEPTGRPPAAWPEI